jgi:hypothetical protein
VARAVGSRDRSGAIPGLEVLGFSGQRGLWRRAAVAATAATARVLWWSWSGERGSGGRTVSSPCRLECSERLCKRTKKRVCQGPTGVLCASESRLPGSKQLKQRARKENKAKKGVEVSAAKRKKECRPSVHPSRAGPKTVVSRRGLRERKESPKPEQRDEKENKSPREGSVQIWTPGPPPVGFRGRRRRRSGMRRHWAGRISTGDFNPLHRASCSEPPHDWHPPLQSPPPAAGRTSMWLAP